MSMQILISLLVIYFSVVSAYAQQFMPPLPGSGIQGSLNAFRQYKEIVAPAIAVPTVVEVPFTEQFFERQQFAAQNQNTGLFEPYFVKQAVQVNAAAVTASANASPGTAQFMTDENLRTFSDFTLPQGGGQGRAQIVLTSSSPITSSGLTVLLEQYVALPNTIEIRAAGPAGETIVVAPRKMESQTILFPRTTASRWTISFVYGQPLRITELRLNQEQAVKSSSLAVRFLAQPGVSYRLYFDPDRSVNIFVGEQGNLADDKGVLRLPLFPSLSNPQYMIADVDGDSVPDIHDNCVTEANADQADADKNGRGDACDDFDRDGLINNKDNCPNQPNRDQKDTDGDRIGDVCDKEESRITEKYKWLPWAGIGFAAVVLVVLFSLTARRMKNGA